MTIKLEKEYYTTGEVARMLGLDYTTVFTWIQQGKIKALQPIKRGWWRIPREEVEKLLGQIEVKN